MTTLSDTIETLHDYSLVSNTYDDKGKPKKPNLLKWTTPGSHINETSMVGLSAKTGSAENLIVLDLDIANTGEDYEETSLARIYRFFRKYPHLLQRTPSGGIHLIMRPFYNNQLTSCIDVFYNTDHKKWIKADILFENKKFNIAPTPGYEIRSELGTLPLLSEIPVMSEALHSILYRATHLYKPRVKASENKISPLKFPKLREVCNNLTTEAISDFESWYQIMYCVANLSKFSEEGKQLAFEVSQRTNKNNSISDTADLDKFFRPNGMNLGLTKLLSFTRDEYEYTHKDEPDEKHVKINLKKDYTDLLPELYSDGNTLYSLMDPLKRVKFTSIYDLIEALREVTPKCVFRVGSPTGYHFIFYMEEEFVSVRSLDDVVFNLKGS